MISRSLGFLSATLALAFAGPLHAAPAANVSSATYHIERHNQQVTVKDTDGKMLAVFSAATPTTQGVLTKIAPDGSTILVNKAAPYRQTFMLKDQNGKRLWSALVPVVSPTHFHLNFNTDMIGTEIMIDNKPEDTHSPNAPSASRLFFTLGADGRPLSAGDDQGNKFALTPTGGVFTDPDGKVLFKAQGVPNNGAVFTGPDGMSGSVKTTDTGAIINLNGTSFVIKKVVKDGKTYSSFPWNGHNVMVDQSCTLGFTSDGDLTVDVPSAAKTAASK